MKKVRLNPPGALPFRTVKGLGALMLAATVFYAGCQKSNEVTQTPEHPETVLVTEAGDNDLNMKGGSAVSATPTGPATIAIYPLRAAHNTGYDSATQCAPSSWNCNDDHSNSDFIGGDHYGIDIWGDLNAPIVAPVTGVITYKGFDSGLGNTVVIREPSGWHHWLGHMNSIAAYVPAVGATITAGTLIGNLGHTGSNSGGVNHLHYSVNHGSGFWSTGQNFWGILNAKETNVCGIAPLPPQAIANGRYKITSRLSGKVANIFGASTGDGATVRQLAYTAAAPTNDEWDVAKLANGFYRITNANSGKDMIVVSASYLQNAKIAQWPYTSNTSYDDEWAIVSVGSGYYKIVNRRSQLVLNVEGAVTTDNVYIIQYGYNGSTASQWTFTLVP